MKTYKIITALLISLNINVFSQAVVDEPNQYETTWRNLQVVRNMLNNQDNSKPLNFKDIKGSPYLYDTFKKGDFFVNNKSLGTFNLRYNVYSDEIEVLDDNQLKSINNDNLKLEAFLRLDNSKAIIEDKTIEFFNYKNNKDIDSKGYFIVLHKNDLQSLLVKKRCVLTPPRKAATFNEADRAARFNIYSDYYILSNDQITPKRFEMKKNEILKLFPEKKELIKTFIKKNKIDLKDQDDIIKLFKYTSSQY